MKLLDLFCGAGGAGMGYARAGFEVLGVDNRPQPHYPFPFVQGDALAYLRAQGHSFHAIHASPPCQAYSKTRKILEGKGLANNHPDLVAPTRDLLKLVGVPWAIENVPGAPLIDPIVLCGTQFGLKVYRHRLFESSIPLVSPPHAKHTETTGSHRGYSKDMPFITVGGHNFSREQAAAAMGMSTLKQAKMGRPSTTGQFIHVVGHFSDVGYVREAMDIPWMTRDELAQAIPPAYTEYVGIQLLARLVRAA